MNPLLFIQLLGPLLSGLAQRQSIAATPTPEKEQALAGINPAVLAALLAAMRPAEPAPTPEIKLPRSAAVVAAIVVVGFFLLLAAISGLLVFGKEQFGAALAVLCVGFGVLASKFGTVVDYLFGSSWGSRVKDAWRPAEGQGSVVPVPMPQPSPQPLPKPEPAPAPTVPVLTIEGRCSWFGGPHDTGSGDPNEGLALYNEEQAAKRPDLFLSVGSGLFRRLNPDAHYMACRWDYKKTPAAHLRSVKVKVTNAKTGKFVDDVFPVDWGPNERTGRAVDLSPGIMTELGLETDDVVVVEIPLPSGAAATQEKQPELVPEHPHILNDAEIKKAFGDFSYTESSGGRIRIDTEWVKENIVDVEIPQLSGVGIKTVQFHRKAADALKAAFADIEEAGLVDRIITFDGTWVSRHKNWDVSRGLSRHSWGIAIDMNAGWNGYGTSGAPKGTHGSVVELVPFFENNGFAWGGLWTPASARDPMHMEFGIPV